MLLNDRTRTTFSFGVFAADNGSTLCFLYTYEAPETAV